MRFRAPSRRLAEPDMTPMIDVTFLLLIFFLVTAQMAAKSRSGVRLPVEPGESRLEASAAGFVVVVDADGTVRVGDRAVTPETLAGLAREASSRGNSVVPVVRADLDREIEELRRKLATMTSVNLEALAEAEELATRLATLEAQLADVAGAKESIEQLIARIDDESRRLLGDTIETVRGHFRDLFERLRRWRRRVAEARGKPAWTILDDKALRGIARDKPSSPAALLRVKGIGEKRLADFGSAILDIVAGKEPA